MPTGNQVHPRARGDEVLDRGDCDARRRYIHAAGGRWDLRAEKRHCAHCRTAHPRARGQNVGVLAGVALCIGTSTRARGSEATGPGANPSDAGSYPRARGNGGAAPQRASEFDRHIHAPVGTTGQPHPRRDGPRYIHAPWERLSWAEIMMRSFAAHPRTRGNDSLLRAPSGIGPGTSTQHARERRMASSRSKCRPPAHPRTHGNGSCTRTDAGASTHAWKLLGRVHSLRLRCASIHPHARGTTVPWGGYRPACQAHPRTRGSNERLPAPRQRSSGTSSHAWERRVGG